MIKTISFIITSLLAISLTAQDQQTFIDSLLLEGNNAYASNNFPKAKEFYTKIIEQDSTHLDATFNLAASELSLDENNAACKHFNQAYYLGAEDARPIIKEYCGSIAYRDEMFSGDVDKLPTFQFKDTSLPLFIQPNNFEGKFPPIEINPKFIKLITAAIRKEKSFKPLKETVRVFFKFDKSGTFHIEKFTGTIDKNQQDKLSYILNTTTQLTPAIYQGKPVGIYRRMGLPINF